MDQHQPGLAPAAARLDPNLWHILTITALIGACLLITRPFLVTVTWAVILTVSGWPSYVAIRRLLGGRARLTGALFVLAGMLLLLVPLVLAGMSAVQRAPAVMGAILGVEQHGLPGPPAAVGRLPLVGHGLEQFWGKVSAQGTQALFQYSPEINLALRWLLIHSGSFGLTVLQFALAIMIAGWLLVRADRAQILLAAFAERIGGPQAVALLPLASHTIRAVSFGVVGTSLAEGMLSAIGFLIAGTQEAVLLGGATFVLCLLQLGPGLVFLAAAAWTWYGGSTAWAVFILLWHVALVLPVEMFGRPLFISRGTGLPILLIFVGVLGGLLAFGFIGVFVGATVLAVSYTLLLRWLEPA